MTTPGWSAPRSTPPKSPPVLESPAEVFVGVRETHSERVPLSETVDGFRSFSVSTFADLANAPSRSPTSIASRLLSRRDANAASASDSLAARRGGPSGGRRAARDARVRDGRADDTVSPYGDTAAS